MSGMANRTGIPHVFKCQQDLGCVCMALAYMDKLNGLNCLGILVAVSWDSALSTFSAVIGDEFAESVPVKQKSNFF